MVEICYVEITVLKSKISQTLVLTNHRGIPNLRNVSIICFGVCLTILMIHSYQLMMCFCKYKKSKLRCVNQIRYETKLT